MSWSWLTRVVSRSLPVCRIIILYRHVSRVQSRPADTSRFAGIYTRCGRNYCCQFDTYRLYASLRTIVPDPVYSAVTLVQRYVSYDRKCCGQPMLDRLENSFD